MVYDRRMFATLAGSYPRAAGMSPAEALAGVLLDQASAGLGLLSDGLVHPAHVPPGELVAAWVAARDAAGRAELDQAVKVAITGPWASGGPTGALEAAGSLNAALAALAAAGCPLVEVHEPAVSLPADDAGRGLFAAAHAALLDGVADRIHASLAVTGGDAVGLGAGALFAAPYRSHLFDLVDGPDSWRLVAVAPRERGIVAGVGDATGRGRSRLEDVVWAAGYAASTGGRGPDRVGLAPSAGLADLEPAQARAVIALVGEAAALQASGGAEVLDRLDPRATGAQRPTRTPHRRPGSRPGD